MTDPTRFDLDDRQRAMLAEMGIRVWWPQAEHGLRQAQPERNQAQPEGKQVQHEGVQAQAEQTATGPALRTAVRPEPAITARPALSPAVRPEPVEGRSPLPDVTQMDWDTLQATVAGCRACTLCQGRRNTVFGVGDRSARWMVIGEAPGENEDLQGEPFVGQAGKLLDNMLRAIGLDRTVQGATDGRAGVYIANTLKCRPPGNRNPEPEELQTCAPYLMRQVALVQPRIILAMGRFAVQSLLQTTEPIGRLRGRVHRYQGVPVVVTYHPAYLLRNPADKAKAWADLCLALQTAQD